MPAWAKGKTPREIVEMTNKMVQQVGMPRQQQQQQPSQPAPQTPQQPTMNNDQMPELPDPSLAYTNKAEYNRQLQQYMQAMQLNTLQQYSQPIVNNNADTALHLSKTGPFKDVWDKWEPEVMSELANVPRQNWTVSLLNKAAQIVRSNHLDEIVREEAEKMASQMQPSTPAVEGTEPGGMPGQAPTAGPLDQLFADNDPAIRRFKEAGLSAADIRKRLPAMSTTEEEYVENLKQSNIITDGKYTQVSANAYN